MFAIVVGSFLCRADAAELAPVVDRPNLAARYAVQLGAYKNKHLALRYRRTLMTGAKNLFAHSPIDVVRSRDGARNGIVYRLRIRAISTRTEARALCRTLKRSHIDCFALAVSGHSVAVVAGQRHSASRPAQLRSAKRTRSRSADSVPSGATRRENETKAAELEITGLFLDHTLTRGGHEFHDALVRNLGLDFESPYTITVLESAQIGSSTAVTVLIQDTPVFRSRLNPLPDRVEAAAKLAADKVIAALVDRNTKLRELDYY